VVLSFTSNLNIKTEDSGKFILIWSGATATGIIAIQIAKLGFGLKVINAAS
jgi:NADPH:quinone reductase-like Zn-dependent oxidoreductase